MFSGVVTRCILAASTLPRGKDAARAVMHAVAAHRDEFEFEKNCSGSNMDRSPNQLITLLERYTDLPLAQAFAIPDLDAEIKRHSKYARQNGIHASPTFMIDGLIHPNLASGDDVQKWALCLK
jgi:hypothetical protein